MEFTKANPLLSTHFSSSVSFFGISRQIQPVELAVAELADNFSLVLLIIFPHAKLLAALTFADSPAFWRRLVRFVGN